MKTTPVYIQDVEHAAKRALISANPDYYSLNENQQEQFRATMEDAVSDRVYDMLWHSLFSDINLDKDGELSNEQQTLFNCAKLLTNGIGRDHLYLNEHLPQNESLLDFSTLYDYDYDSHLFQESERKKADKNYSGIPYYPFKFPPWIRLIIDNQFYYGSCLSVAGYILEEIEQISGEVIQQLIPHRYIDGEEHGESTAKGMVWDQKLDAGGQERQLEELQERWREYSSERWLSLSKEYVSLPPAVYTCDVKDDEDPHRLFIFNNEAALKLTRWKCFLDDVSVLQHDYSQLNETINKETNQAQAFLQTQYDDIMEHFDPTIVKFKKKMKIIIAPNALDDL